MLVNDKIYDGNNIAYITFKDELFNITSYDAIYDNKNTGLNKKVFVKNIKCTNNNYIINDTITNGNILPLILNVEYYGEDKIYNNSNNITGYFNILNKIDNDDININTTILFNNPLAENNKTLIYNNIKINGNDSYNYKLVKIKLNNPTIFKIKLEFEFIGLNKIYDSTCNAFVKLKNINNKLINDNVRIKSYKAFFEDKNVGINKKILITNIELINDYGNYYCDNTCTFANIDKKNIFLSIESYPKEYDGTINADIKLLNIKGIYFNDNLFIQNYKSEFKDCNVGNNKLITVYDIELGGIDQDNYFCEKINITSNINKKKILLNILNTQKTFDNKINIDVKLEINNLINDDIITIKSYNSYFDNCYIGNNKKIYINNIKLEGKSISNYFINDLITIGEIIPSYLNLKFIINDKIFDNKTNANVLISEKYNIIFEAHYEDFNVGNNKKIIVNIISYDIDNYLLYDKYYLVGNIIPQNILLDYQCTDKIFDNSKNYNIHLYYKNDDIKINVIDYNVEFEDENIGTNKKVFISNIKLDNINYICQDFIIYSNILPQSLKLDYSIKQKKFDGTNKVLPIIFNNDYNINILSYNAEYNSSNVNCNNKIFISNIKLNNKNYYVDDFFINSEIIPKDIDINIILEDKEYDGNTICKIKFSDFEIINYNAYFQNERIENNKIVYIKNIQLLDKNFVCNDFELKSSINKKSLKIIFKDFFKEYDNTNNISLHIESLEGIVKNENVYIESFNSSLSNTKVGLCFLLLSNIKLKGNDSDNYFINNYKLEIEIIKKKLLFNIIAIDKKFDQNKHAIINISLNNIINNDDIYIEYYISEYIDENIGFNKEILVSQIIIGGIDKDNYYYDNNILIYGNIL